MATTNNGWTTDPPLTRVYVGGDADGCTFRAGDVATLFAWFFGEMHRTIETITVLNGARTAAYNASIGGAAGSNHVSGTAGDVNGSRHPYEYHLPPSQSGSNYKSGWSSAQQSAIRSLMASTGGLISWGLDYNVGYRDAMHFDITKGKTSTDVARFVASLGGGSLTDGDDFMSALTYDEQRRVLQAADTWLTWCNSIKTNTDRLPIIHANSDLTVAGNDNITNGVVELLDALHAFQDFLDELDDVQLGGYAQHHRRRRHDRDE
jgi:hypothetical protein